MAFDQQATRDALLQAAGELFADLGFDGASTREIAGKANTNMASIGYHFKGKENLYLETLRFVLEGEGTWAETITHAQDLRRRGASVYEALRAALRRRLGEVLGREQPIWQIKLVLRALLEPSPALSALTRESFAPQIAKAVEAAREWNPALSEAEARLWANSLFGQEMVYVLARKVILDMEQWEDFPSEYLDELAGHMARLMSAALWPEALSTGDGPPNGSSSNPAQG